jgi:hypothetical protein
MAAADFSQPKQVTLPVFVGFKKHLASIPARHQVVNRTGILITQGPWHGSSNGERRTIVKPFC